MTSPKIRLWLSFLVFIAIIMLVLLITAGTVAYWQAWVFLGVSIATSTPLVMYMSSDPVLLENRTAGGAVPWLAEQRLIQRLIVLCLGVPVLATFIVPALDRRFGWSSVPPWLCIVGDLVIVLSMWMVYRVFRENSFGSATVGVTEGQRVISTGPYAMVRHPMYACAIVYFIGTALALGSFWGLIPAVLTTLGFAWRLYDEETFLAQNLPGYTEYCARVRWHLIPGIF